MAGWRDIFSGLTREGSPMGGLGNQSLGVPSSGAGYAPGTGPGGINAGQLEPNSRAANMAAGVPYQLVPCYPAFIRLANDPNIGYQIRQRTLIFGGNGVAAATTTQQFQFSLPTIVYGRTGTGFLANDNGLPVGRSGLETFRIQMFRAGSQSDLIDAGGGGANNPSVNTIGANLLGPGSLPALFGANGLFFDTGSYLNCTCQILMASIEVHITLLAVEEYGPARG